MNIPVNIGFLINMDHISYHHQYLLDYYAKHYNDKHLRYAHVPHVFFSTQPEFEEIVKTVRFHKETEMQQFCNT